MTKQAVIAIVVGVLIILGAGGAFLYSQNKPSENTSNTTVAEQTTVTPQESMTQSITDIFSSGNNSKCTFNTTSNSGKTSGTIFVSGENAKAEIATTDNGKKTNTYMIKNNETFYMWGDSLPTGIKMVIKMDELADKIQGNEQLGSLNPGEKMDFNCVTWSPDNALFTPPANIKFISFEGMMPNEETKKTTVAPTGGTSSQSTDTSSQCSICNSLTGTAKTACLAQFNCQ